jgi:ribosomal protein S18 acetylase RimI-like enzyme
VTVATITPAETEDADRLVDLWIELAESQRDHGSHIRGEPNRTPIRESILRHIAGDRLLVARSDGIRGFVMIAVEGGSYEQDLRRGLIENLYVRPDARNEGLGSALLSRAESQLTDRGVDAVTLDVMADNERARRFYREHGYDPHRVEFEKPVG